MSHTLSIRSMSDFGRTTNNLSIVLNDGVTMSIAWGEGTYSSEATVEVAFFPTGTRGDQQVRPDFPQSGDGAGIYGWVPIDEALAYAAANTKEV